MEGYTGLHTGGNAAGRKENNDHMTRRFLAMLLSIVLLLSGLAGCGKQEEPLPSTAPATGRYVESEISLPALGYPMDMVKLSDGRLRIGLLTGEAQYQVFTRDASGNWEEDVTLPGNLSDYGEAELFRLSPNGEVFLSMVQDKGDGTYDYRFLLLSSDGELREIPLTYSQVREREGFLLGGGDFTDSGKLMLLFYFDDLREIDLSDGSLSKNLNEQSAVLSSARLGCAGEDAYLYNSQGDGNCTVVREGRQTNLPDVLTEQLTASALATSGMDGKTVFWQNDQGYLFFTTNEGLYSFVPGGTVTEELVSPAKSSFGSPSFVPKALAGTEDGTFYIFGSQSGQAVLCRYDYDENAPVTASNQLKLYSLYDDDDLRQMITLYQKAHPDTDVELEIGLSGEDGVTEADALRTLNTEILAGSGPDVLRLDGISLDSYLKQDVFVDLSDLLTETKTLEQITRCYASGDKVSVIPAAFAIPAIYGPETLISQITDLDSLVRVARQALAENPNAQSLMNGLMPRLVVDSIYDSCSAAWQKADGTLDAQALEQFMEAMNELYAMDAPLRERYADILKAMEDEGDPYSPGDYTGIAGASSVFLNGAALSVGTLESMDLWSFAVAGDDQLEGYTLLPLKAQAQGVFLPRQLFGVLSTSGQVEKAKEFVSFALGEEVQSGALGFGFPVNQTVFDKQIQEDKVADASFATSDEDGNMISYMARYPSAAERQQLKTWVDGLTTPALTDRTIRNLVEEQAALCLKGSVTPAQATSQALQSLNLYLSE